MDSVLADAEFDIQKVVDADHIIPERYRPRGQGRQSKAGDAADNFEADRYEQRSLAVKRMMSAQRLGGSCVSCGREHSCSA